MRSIARLRIKNWMCFRGEHVLDLDAKPYAIYARREDDAEASNWSGKTAIVEAIRFVLDGLHRHRLDDEWITHGESLGEAELTFDTGERALRTRESGKAGKFWFFPHDNPHGLYKDEAEAALYSRMGLLPPDFGATWFFAQRQMARIINSRPEDRMEMISAWLKLKPLERCEEKARKKVNALLDEVQKLQGRRQSTNERLKAALGGRSLVLCEDDAREASKALDSARDYLKMTEEEWEENEKRRRAKEIREEYNALVSEGQTLAAEFEKIDIDALARADAEASKETDRAVADYGAYHAKHRQLSVLARGAFDGVCPVASIKCPAKDTINGMRAENKKAYEESTTELGRLDVNVSKLRDEKRARGRDLGNAERIRERLESMRERAAKLEEKLEDLPEPIDTATLRAKLATVREHVTSCAQKEAKTKQDLETIAWCDEEQSRIDAEAKVIEEKMRLARAALVVFGKSGAQRRVAEEVLGRIESDANRRLGLAGIPLQVAVQWTREGQKLANACEACGASFPASQKVKECTRCGAARGFQIQNKLDFLLSDRSGAAEDLAGIAVQLAARDWLLSDRGSEWQPVVIDEAFGQLDAANRRALAQHLGMLLGAQQAFIIAHHAQVLDALPGRIEIVRGRDFSTVRVA